MNAAIERPRARRLNPLALALGLVAFVAAMAFLGFWAQRSEAAPVTHSAVLLETEPAPWGDEFNEEAMGEAFGTDWEKQEFATVQADESAGGLFGSGVGFIWIEGSDDSTAEAQAFVAAHEAQLKAFVARGGSLFINSATNENITIEYDGRAVGLASGFDYSDAVAAADPSQPIFHEPNPLTTTEFTGTDFGQGSVSGEGVTPLIVNDEEGEEADGHVVLGIYKSGLGHVALGTMTVVQYQQPTEDAEKLRINLLDYLKGLITHEAAKVTPAPTTTAPQVTPVAQCVVPKLRGMTLKQAKAALTAAHCGLDKVAHKPSISLKKGKVIRQRPVAGTVRGAGSEVSFRLGRG